MNLLYGSFGIEGGNIGIDVIVSFSSDLFEINVVIKFYVFGVDLENFKMVSWVRDINVDFMIEMIEVVEGRINRVGFVGSSYDYNVGMGFYVVYEG